MNPFGEDHTCHYNAPHFNVVICCLKDERASFQLFFLKLDTFYRSKITSKATTDALKESPLPL